MSSNREESTQEQQQQQQHESNQQAYGIHIVLQYFKVKSMLKNDDDDDKAIDRHQDSVIRRRRRQREYDECLYRNLDHPMVLSVHVLLENDVDEQCLKLTLDRLKSWLGWKVNKLRTTMIGRQMLYGDAFEYCNQHLVGKIAVIMNSDIFIGPGVELLFEEKQQDNKTSMKEELFKDTIFSLTRHENKICKFSKKKQLQQTADIDAAPSLRSAVDLHCGCPFIPNPVENKTHYAGSHDSFWFVPPLASRHFCKKVRHVQNRWGAEHLVIKELIAHGFKVINPSLSIITFHNHASAIRPWHNENNNGANEQPISSPKHHLPLYPIHLGETYPWWPSILPAVSNSDDHLGDNDNNNDSNDSFEVGDRNSSETPPPQPTSSDMSSNTRTFPNQDYGGNDSNANSTNQSSHEVDEEQNTLNTGNTSTTADTSVSLSSWLSSLDQENSIDQCSQTSIPAPDSTTMSAEESREEQLVMNKCHDIQEHLSFLNARQDQTPVAVLTSAAQANDGHMTKNGRQMTVSLPSPPSNISLSSSSSSSSSSSLSLSPRVSTPGLERSQKNNDSGITAKTADTSSDSSASSKGVCGENISTGKNLDEKKSAGLVSSSPSSLSPLSLPSKTNGEGAPDPDTQSLNSGPAQSFCSNRSRRSRRSATTEKSNIVLVPSQVLPEQEEPTRRKAPACVRRQEDGCSASRRRNNEISDGCDSSSTKSRVRARLRQRREEMKKKEDQLQQQQQQQEQSPSPAIQENRKPPEIILASDCSVTDVSSIGTNTNYGVKQSQPIHHHHREEEGANIAAPTSVSRQLQELVANRTENSAANVTTPDIFSRESEEIVTNRAENVGKQRPFETASMTIEADMVVRRKPVILLESEVALGKIKNGKNRDDDTMGTQQPLRKESIGEVQGDACNNGEDIDCGITEKTKITTSRFKSSRFGVNKEKKKKNRILPFFNPVGKQNNKQSKPDVGRNYIQPTSSAEDENDRRQPRWRQFQHQHRQTNRKNSASKNRLVSYQSQTKIQMIPEDDGCDFFKILGPHIEEGCDDTEVENNESTNSNSTSSRNRSTGTRQRHIKKSSSNVSGGSTARMSRRGGDGSGGGGGGGGGRGGGGDHNSNSSVDTYGYKSVDTYGYIRRKHF